VDRSGNLYIADTDNSRIREVFAANNLIITVEGTGMSGFAGDGGPATSAELFTPNGITLDSLGNYYIADTGNARIREVSGGNINTVAGSVNRGFCGDGGPATSACLSLPVSMGIDQQGEIFLADPGNSRIRLAYNGNISTFAGQSTFGFCGDGGSPTKACLNSSYGVTVTSSGKNIFIADTYNNRVRFATPNPFRCSMTVVHLLRTTGRLPFPQEYPAGCQ
jgi:hypothetical protein